jgi:bilirubin oxidase
VGAQTASPITAVPSALTTNSLLSAANANTTRYLTISDSSGVPNILGPNAFIINHRLFNINYVDYDVPLNNTEIWQITSSSVFGHPFHIHDVEFNILSINGAAPDATQAGWKDVVFIKGRTGPTNTVVRFIAKFDDYADPIHPFMYHCHISLHEDEGMMGQFVVSSPTALRQTEANEIAYTVYPNPTSNKLFVAFSEPAQTAYYVRILDAVGRTMLMLPKPDLQQGIDLSSFPKGLYTLQLTDGQYKRTSCKTFVVE